MHEVPENSRIQELIKSKSIRNQNKQQVKSNFFQKNFKTSLAKKFFNNNILPLFSTNFEKS
jgi:hypothetical protein